MSFHLQHPGGFSEMVTPLPIPNRDVKHLSGDDNGPATDCESSSLPGLSKNLPEKGDFLVEYKNNYNKYI